MYYFENAVYLIITGFVAGFMLFYMSKQLKKQEVKTKDEGCRYCYELSIKLRFGEVIQFMLYSDSKYTQISHLLFHCSAIKNERKEIQYRDGNQSTVVFKENIAEIHMCIIERTS